MRTFLYDVIYSGIDGNTNGDSFGNGKVCDWDVMFWLELNLGKN